MRARVSIIVLLILTTIGTQIIRAQDTPTTESYESFYSVIEGISWSDFQVVHEEKESDCWENQPEFLQFLENKRLIRRTHYNVATAKLRKLFDEVNNIMDADSYVANENAEINTAGDLAIDKLFLSYGESIGPKDFVIKVRSRRGLTKEDPFQPNEINDFTKLYRFFRAAEKTALSVEFPTYEVKRCKITENLNLTPKSLGPTRVMWNVSLDVVQKCRCRLATNPSGWVERVYKLEIDVVSTIKNNNINTIKFWPPTEGKEKPRLSLRSQDCCGDEVPDELPEQKEKPRKRIKKVGSLWTPPNGTTRIAAVGTVRDEEVMMTARGTIGGTVIVESKDGEKVAETKPDEDGRFSIDFGQLALGAAATQLILTALDENGVPQTSTPVTYLPGDPGGIVDKPTLVEPEVPYVEQQAIGQFEGANFGEAAQVVVTPQGEEAMLAETVSASGNMVQYYADVPVGPAEVYVQNEFGQSEPIELGIYKLGVGAEKMNLSRNESTQINAVFAGLPSGTKIIFTNRSSNIRIKAIGPGRNLGNEVVFIVRDSLGEVSLNVKAKQAGGWNVDYRLEFPN